MHSGDIELSLLITWFMYQYYAVDLPVFRQTLLFSFDCGDVVDIATIYVQ